MICSRQAPRVHALLHHAARAYCTSQVRIRPTAHPLTRDQRRYYAEHVIKVPEMAESISEGTLKQWSKAVGDYVERDEEIATIETDKIDVSVNAPESGTITELMAKEEDTVTVGQEIGKMETGGAASEGGAKTAKQEPKEPASSEQKTASQPEGGKEQEKKADPPKEEPKEEAKPAPKETKQQESAPPQDSKPAPQPAPAAAQPKQQDQKKVESSAPRQTPREDGLGSRDERRVSIWLCWS